MTSAAARSRWLPGRALMAGDSTRRQERDACFRHAFAVPSAGMSGQGRGLKYRLCDASGCVSSHELGGGGHGEGRLHREGVHTVGLLIRTVVRWELAARVDLQRSHCKRTKELGSYGTGSIRNRRLGGDHHVTVYYMFYVNQNINCYTVTTHSVLNYPFCRN